MKLFRLVNLNYIKLEKVNEVYETKIPLEKFMFFLLFFLVYYEKSFLQKQKKRNNNNLKAMSKRFNVLKWLMLSVPEFKIHSMFEVKYEKLHHSIHSSSKLHSIFYKHLSSIRILYYLNAILWNGIFITIHLFAVKRFSEIYTNVH